MQYAPFCYVDTIQRSNCALSRSCGAAEQDAKNVTMRSFGNKSVRFDDTPASFDEKFDFLTRFCKFPLDTNGCSMYSIGKSRTLVRLEERAMTGWSFFFMLMGVAVLAAQVFRLVDYIERPAHRPRHRAAVR